MFDSDGGQFSAGKFSKYLDGTLFQEGTIEQTATPTNGSFPVAFSSTPVPRQDGARIGSVATNRVSTMFPTSTTAFAHYVRAVETNSYLTSDTYTWFSHGNWTDNYPIIT